MTFQPIKKFLNKSIKKAGVATQVEAAMVLEEFQKLIGELFGNRVENRVKPMYLKNRTLTIACISSVLAQEIKLNERKIIDPINKKFGKNTVERLRFLV